MSKKSRINKGDESINRIHLETVPYDESILVDKICTIAQKRSYHKKEKFANSKQRSMFIDRLSQYCEFEYDPGAKWISVKKIFDYPKTRAELKIHDGIYLYLTPLLLNEIIHSDNDRQSLFSVYELTKKSHMMNRNYGTMKFAQNEVSSGLQIPNKTVSEYFDKADGYFHYYIKKCLNYLAETSCIIFSEVPIIKKVTFLDAEINLNGCKVRGKPDVHKATEEEMNLYAKLLETVDNELDIHSNQDRWFGKKAWTYQSTLSKLLKDYNIEYIVQGFEIYCVHPDRCQEIILTSSEHSLDYYRQGIGALLKEIVDSNAESRAEKHKLLDADYLEHFKDLSEISLPYGAEDIIKRIPALKGSYDKRIMRKSEEMEFKYSEI